MVENRNTLSLNCSPHPSLPSLISVYLTTIDSACGIAMGSVVKLLWIQIQNKVTMAIPDAEFSAVRFCSYIPYVVRSTIGLLTS